MPPDGPQRTSWLTLLLGVGGAGLGFVFLAITRESILGWVIAIAGGFRLVGWFFLTYEVTEHELVIRSGLVQRRTQVVPYQRVQQVDFHRNITAQVFGLTEMRIDTAGSTAGKIHLAYLDLAAAERLRAHLLERRAHWAGERAAIVASKTGDGSDATVRASADRSPTPIPEPPLRLLEQPLVDLLRAGATNDLTVGLGTLWLVAAVGTFGVALVDRAEARSLLSGLAAGIGMLVLIAFGLTARIAFAFYGLRLERTSEELRIDYGLTARHHLTMPLSRIHRITVTDNPLRRRLGIVELRLHSAAAPGGGESSQMVVPGIGAADVRRVLEAVARPAAALVVDDLVRRPAAARRRGILRRTVPFALLAVVGALLWFPSGLALGPMVAVGWWWGVVADRRAGHALDQGWAAFGAGAVVHVRTAIPLDRVQSTRTVSSWFQRRVDLATLRLDLIGASPGLYDMDSGTAERVAATAITRPQVRARAPLGS